MVVNPTATTLKRHAVERLLNRDSKRQLYSQLKFMMGFVNECELEGHTKMKPAWARLCEHSLAFTRASRRFDAGDASVEEIQAENLDRAAGIYAAPPPR